VALTAPRPTTAACSSSISARLRVLFACVYPPGVSSTANADLRLTGNANSALLSGDVVVTKPPSLRI